jgi:hypothetical protein
MTEQRENVVEQVLNQGVLLLEPLLVSHGFSLVHGDSGEGSGGRFAICEFRRGDRRLEFHFRYSLGLVTYHLGGMSLSHESFMWSVLGRRHCGHYPGFSAAPLDAFRALLMDLQEHAEDFLSGSDADFLYHVVHAEELRLANSAPPV